MFSLILSMLLIGKLTTVANAAGLLTPKDRSLPELDIKDHHVQVVLEDGYAITTVDQIFYNPHDSDLEAIYSFPVPDKAAMSEFTMWIDGKPIQGEVLEKKKAREVYEDQKKQGKNAGLTEKDGYKTFETSVYPVRANQETRIRLSYIQPAAVDLGMGQYTYPLEEGGVDDHKLSFWTANEEVTGTFNFDLVIRSSYPIDGVRLPGHPGAQIVQNEDEWVIHLDNLVDHSGGLNGTDQSLTINNQQEEMEAQPAALNSNFRLDKDIVVYYRLTDNLPGSVDLVAYKTEGDKRGTFMLTITPGMDLQPIIEGRDWVFVLDVSGSMQGKYFTLTEGVSRALENMTERDRFRIITFNETSREISRGFIPATRENVQTYIDRVRQVQPGGGTNVYRGLQQGLKSLDADRTSSIILVTDGVANVGITQQKKFIELIKKKDIRLFTFIMGNSANKPLLNALTRHSHGFAINVSNSDDIVGKILLATNKVNFQSLHGAALKIKGIKTFDLTPKDIGSLYRGQQLVVFGHYYGSGKADVSLQGRISGKDIVYQTQFDFPVIADQNPEIERLWAYATIEDLTEQMDDFGETDDTKNAIIDIGLEYSLVTDYTSMVVVEEDVFKELGIERRNQARLATENQSRQKRRARPVQSRRVDTGSPMFNHNQPTTRSRGGGAGAIDPFYFLLLLPFFRGFINNRRKR
ncbi:MAG: VIT and VWA domain-containing protein [Candidatus Omnitrophica bacterium]|nr:VIT and VWA domain-containing protein [Candidatus Omnitrophota bacterium]